MKNIYIEKLVRDSEDPFQTDWMQKISGQKKDAICCFQASNNIISFKTSRFLLPALHFVCYHPKCTLREITLFHYLFNLVALDHLGQDFSLQNRLIYGPLDYFSFYHIKKEFRSAMFHIGFYLSSGGIKEVLSLKSLKLDPKHFGITIMQAYVNEIEDFLSPKLQSAKLIE